MALEVLEVVALLALAPLVLSQLEFAVHILEGGGATADSLAERHGMINMGEVSR